MFFKLVVFWVIIIIVKVKKFISFEFRFYMSIFNDKIGL